MSERTALYRVYFAVEQTTYYVVEASNVRKAIWRAKRLQRAFPPTDLEKNHG